MFNFIKKSGIYILGFVLFAGVFFSGIAVGYNSRPEIEKIKNIANKETGKNPETDFASFWKTWNVLREKYASENGFDDQKMVWGAISGMVNSLGDPYTTFFPPVEKKNFESDVKGSFEGVGMEIGIRKNVLTVIAPLKGSPAEQAGISTGDRILKIDDKETIDMTVTEAVEIIRGEKGTIVRLIVLKEDEEEPREISITRDVISIPVIETEIKNNKIFVIKLYSFSENSPEAMRKALREMVNSGSDKLILDLRSNPGGYLEASVDIASWFLPLGKVVAKEKFTDGKEVLYRSKGYDVFRNLKMVVLINQGSASASEILAGALHEHNKTTLIGEKTFGKGSVQELVNITSDTALKVTIARWLTPNGLSISKEGLKPDIEVKMEKKDIEENRDPQMDKALDVLSK